jgi:Alginate export
MMRPRACFLAVVGLLAAAAIVSTAVAGDDEAVRPKIHFSYRWQEDWSVLADPRLRTEPLDSLKYIPLPFDDPKSYVSLGLTLRERFELNDAPSFGIAGNKADSYLLDRLQWHVNVRPNADWQIFVQFEDVRAPGKSVITPVDENPLDLRLAFVAYVDSFWGGTLKARVGRQEMAFDLQRFVSVRDGPNVRQAYDAVWLDWEQRQWRVIGFWSQPVQYRQEHPFDDFSSGHLQYGGVRAETPEQVRPMLVQALEHDGPALVEVVVNRQELAMPPSIELNQMMGFSLYMLKAVLNGRGDELIDLVKTNLFR